MRGLVLAMVLAPVVIGERPPPPRRDILRNARERLGNRGPMPDRDLQQLLKKQGRSRFPSVEPLPLVERESPPALRIKTLERLPEPLRLRAKTTSHQDAI